MSLTLAAILALSAQASTSFDNIPDAPLVPDAKELFSNPPKALPNAEGFCASITEFGRSVAMSRQYGVPLTETMDILATGRGQEGHELRRAILLWAYERPRYSDKAEQEREIDEFEGLVLAMCISKAVEAGVAQ